MTVPENPAYPENHDAAAHEAADPGTFVRDCAECWRERLLWAMWQDRADRDIS